MPRSSGASSNLPAASGLSLKTLGADIATARKRRRLPQRLMAERMLVSLQTLQRLEKGDPTVGLSVLASALFVLGLTERLGHLAAPETDTVGMGEEIRRLPERTRSRAPDPDLDF